MRRIGLAVILTLGLIFTLLAAEAQQQSKIYRIGVLDFVPVTSNAANLSALRQGLRELGYVEGQNLIIEYRSADGQAERFPSFAAELVRLKVDVIVTRGTPAALAAKHATGTVPIVMAASSNPVWHWRRRQSGASGRQHHGAERHWHRDAGQAD